MAMTKKELAIYEGALRDAEIARALRWSGQEPILPDIPAPAPGSDSVTIGYACHVFGFEFRVSPKWSKSHSHGEGHSPPKDCRGSASQNGIDLYSSKARAYEAARQQIERNAADALLRLDCAIREGAGEGRR